MGRFLRSGIYVVAFPVAYSLSVFAGRATRLAGGEVSLVWPAAAVGIVWLLAVAGRGPWERAAHLMLLGAVAFVTNLATGASASLSAWFVVVNVALCAVSTGILVYGRRRAALRDPADLARLVGAVTAGTSCAAVLATMYFVMVMDAPVWETFALFAVRNGATALVGVAIWLRLQDVTWRSPRVTATGVAEALFVAAGVGSVFYWIFWLSTGLPTAFLALVPAMWLALRYSTTVSTVFLTAAGTWIIYATLLDRGSLIVPDVQTRALLSQAMVGSLTLLVLTLSLYRDSRTRLITQLEQARDRADQDSETLSAVLDSIHDGVVVVDSTGTVLLRNARAAASGLADDIVTASPVSDVAGCRAVLTHNGPRDVTVGIGKGRIVEVATAPLVRQQPLSVMAFRDVTDERRTARALREARDLFAGVLDAASEQAIIGTDPDGRITVFNKGAERLLGWTAEEMLGATPMEFHLYSEVCARAAELGIEPGIEVFVHNVTPQTAEVREWIYVRRDGTHAAVSLAVSHMTDEDGQCRGYIGVATDITEQRAAKQALADSEERFRLAFDTAPMGMFMFNVAPARRGRITRCNKAMADLVGYTQAEVLRMAITDFGTGETASNSGDLTQVLNLQPGQTFTAEASIRRADGVAVWGAVSASVVAPRGSEPYGICLVEDVTSRKQAEAELLYMASHDPLTGLANRSLFTTRIEDALAEVDAGRSTGLGVIFLDLDGFKAVNDTWGHAEGDEVLTEVSRRIKASIRPSDTAARLGGDEFAVLCPGIRELPWLQYLAERIRADLRRPITLSGDQSYDQLSVSAGVVLSQTGCTAETLMQQADALMYHAKRGGKDRVTVGVLPLAVDAGAPGNA
ncbi:diguanylate cyclase domain-containing protein [Mycolicibacterium iranicum]|uniref:Diguanylate cyclase n=1 Tax=Mycolicibacterium iranicum TaxID=912594 RepID=A0A178LQS7_MYCIR|nr:diguanylate cyclase [Mycolicibacterium iranicum]OAN36089.1 diguanylate cyclase [Mycolicibacterium iranicum]